MIRSIDDNAFDADGLQGAQIKGHRFDYPGHDLDAEAGRRYHRARHYDPSIGRWVSDEVIGYADAMIEYRYVGNQPCNPTDPTAGE